MYIHIVGRSWSLSIILPAFSEVCLFRVQLSACSRDQYETIKTAFCVCVCVHMCVCTQTRVCVCEQVGQCMVCEYEWNTTVTHNIMCVVSIQCVGTVMSVWVGGCMGMALFM